MTTLADYKAKLREIVDELESYRLESYRSLDNYQFDLLRVSKQQIVLIEALEAIVSAGYYRNCSECSGGERLWDEAKEALDGLVKESK